MPRDFNAMLERPGEPVLPGRRHAIPSAGFQGSRGDRPLVGGERLAARDSCRGISTGSAWAWGSFWGRLHATTAARFQPLRLDHQPARPPRALDFNCYARLSEDTPAVHVGSQAWWGWDFNTVIRLRPRPFWGGWQRRTAGVGFQPVGSASGPRRWDDWQRWMKGVGVQPARRA